MSDGVNEPQRRGGRGGNAEERSKYAGSPEKSARIDLGLAISGALLKPGETRTMHELAAWAGCSQALIYLIELRALKKLRHPAKRRQLEGFLDG